MASNNNRKSASSDSRKSSARSRSVPGQAGKSARPAASKRAGTPRSSGPRSFSQGGNYRALPGGQMPHGRPKQTQPPLKSVRVGDIDRAQRSARAQRTYSRYLIRLGIAAAFLAALALGGVAVFYSNLFTIESVSVKGVEHLTAQDMQNMAGVSAGTTLLRVDAAGIKEKLLKNSWVKDVSVNRVFPNTLELAVTERTIAAVVEVPTQNAERTQQWAIASDGMWLMPIPDQDSEAGRKTSPKVYEDVASVLRITDVPYGTKPEIGTRCTDGNVNNAIDIVSGMTTELAARVTAVKATEKESTTLTLKDGPDIVFGTSENIREKERVCLEIMSQHPDGVAYINVRSVNRPTWRAS